MGQNPVSGGHAPGPHAMGAGPPDERIERLDAEKRTALEDRLTEARQGRVAKARERKLMLQFPDEVLQVPDVAGPQMSKCRGGAHRQQPRSTRTSALVERRRPLDELWQDCLDRGLASWNGQGRVAAGGAAVGAGVASGLGFVTLDPPGLTGGAAWVGRPAVSWAAGAAAPRGSSTGPSRGSRRRDTRQRVAARARGYTHLSGPWG